MTEIVRLGIVGIALLLIGAMLFIAIKFFLPLALATRPPNGKPDSAGPLYILMQQLGTLPVEIKSLNATIAEMMNHVWTKDETMEELKKNRHDVADIMTGPVATFSLELRSAMVEIREIVERQEGDRRRAPRTSAERRKNK